MDFLLGYSSLLPLVGIMLVMLFMNTLLPREMAVSMVYLMILVDGVIAAVWFYSLRDFMVDIKIFKMGIAVSFVSLTVIKCSYFMLKKT